MRATLLILLTFFAIPASAQTMSIWADDHGGIVNAFDVPPATTFELVVTVDSDGHQLSMIDWGMTDPQSIGLMKMGVTSPIGSCGLLPENCFEGSYSIAVNGCHPGGDLVEVVRIQVADFTGSVGSDVVLVIGPNPAGGFADSPGFLDCDDLPVAAPMGGPPGGTTGSGVTWPSGSLILNPTLPVVDVDEDGMSAMKARY